MIFSTPGTICQIGWCIKCKWNGGKRVEPGFLGYDRMDGIKQVLSN
jgi:hypothetical protein